MTGPEHYQVAEIVARDVTSMVNEIADDGTPIKAATVAALLNLAQVHATLALAAATAERSKYGTVSDTWAAVLA